MRVEAQKRQLTSIVHKNVQLIVALLELIGRLSHASKALQVHLEHLDVRFRAFLRPALHDLVSNSLTFRQVPGGEGDGCARQGERADLINTKSIGTSCQEDDLVFQLADETFVVDDLKRSWSRISWTIW